jgi:hypothetical protein
MENVNWQWGYMLSDIHTPKEKPTSAFCVVARGANLNFAFISTSPTVYLAV